MRIITKLLLLTSLGPISSRHSVKYEDHIFSDAAKKQHYLNAFYNLQLESLNFADNFLIPLILVTLFSHTEFNSFL